jgi:flagellar biosynthesis protein FlhG
MIRLVDQADGIRIARPYTDTTLYPRRNNLSATRTVAVTSGKGGVGKTQISANLAVAMGKLGKKVLLIDADLGLASLDLALGIEPRADLTEVVWGNASIEDVLVEAPCGVQLVPACPGRYEMANLSVVDRNRLLTTVREIASRFDTLIIDTSAGIGAIPVTFASIADEVLLVTTPEPASLRDAYAMTKVLHCRTGVKTVHLVANRVSSELEGLEVYDRLQQIVRRFLAIELNYLGCIPQDVSVSRAVLAGEAYVLGAPNSAAARATENLVRRLGFGELPKGETC